MKSIERLANSKLRLKKSFEELEKAITKLKKKNSTLDKNLVLSTASIASEMKQMQSLFLDTLDHINNKMLEIKKLELVE